MRRNQEEILDTIQEPGWKQTQTLKAAASQAEE